jgi:HSP20 family protein
VPSGRRDAFGDSWHKSGHELPFAPRFDVKETKDSFQFKADLPEVSEQDVEISLTGNRLTVSGKREAEEKKEGENYYLLERSWGSFSRSFTLPETADVEKIKAEFKDGILNLSLPKRTESQPRRIPLNR